MRIEVDVAEIVLAGDYRDDIPSVEATCRRCEHTTESFGTDDRSVRRCLALLREECPNGENNFYVVAEES